VEHGHGEHGCAQAGSTMEVDRSQKGRGGEFYFFWQGADGSEDTIASVRDKSVCTDTRVESLLMYFIDK
jgi:hypothetical protein